MPQSFLGLAFCDQIKLIFYNRTSSRIKTVNRPGSNQCSKCSKFFLGVWPDLETNFDSCFTKVTFYLTEYANNLGSTRWMDISSILPLIKMNQLENKINQEAAKKP